MKIIHHLRKPIAGILTLSVLTLALGLHNTARADSQGLAQTFGTLTNLPTTMTNTAISGLTNNYLPLRTYSGLGLETIFQGSNLVTAPVTDYVWPSIDGTNLATTTPFATLTYPANGTNLVIGWTNWSNLQLKGIAGLFINVSNGTTANINLNTVITNGANTNNLIGGGVLYNRPNQ